MDSANDPPSTTNASGQARQYHSLPKTLRRGGDTDQVTNHTFTAMDTTSDSPSTENLGNATKRSHDDVEQEESVKQAVRHVRRLPCYDPGFSLRGSLDWQYLKT
jgi:hypothetical protein